MSDEEVNDSGFYGFDDCPYLERRRGAPGCPSPSLCSERGDCPDIPQLDCNNFHRHTANCYGIDEPGKEL